MKTLITLWIISGFISWGYAIWEEGELIVEDLKMIIPMAIFGPIPVIAIYFESHKYKSLWKRKNK